MQKKTSINIDPELILYLKQRLPWLKKDSDVIKYALVSLAERLATK